MFLHLRKRNRNAGGRTLSRDEKDEWSSLLPYGTTCMPDAGVEMRQRVARQSTRRYLSAKGDAQSSSALNTQHGLAQNTSASLQEREVQPAIGNIGEARQYVAIECYTLSC